MNPLEIKIQYLDESVTRLKKIEIGDWIDLRSAEKVVLEEGDFALINLGVAMKLPEGYEAYLVPRSSTFKNFGFIQTNSCGVIDHSYAGPEDYWRMPVYATRYTVVNKGDRIAQFRIQKCMPPIKFTEVEKLEGKDRGGFGSTGIQ